MTPERKIAEALRLVALRLEHALDADRRSKEFNANDLLDVLTAVADQLAPPQAGESDPHMEVVHAARALLEARENEMVTYIDWDRLQQAVEAVSDR